MTRLSASGVSVRLGGVAVLDRVDFDLGPGDLLGLVGPNGAGKTTLLRAMAGLLPPDAGDVRLDGRRLDDIGPGERARLVGFLPQASAGHWPLAVETVVALGRLPHRSALTGLTAADRGAIERALLACDVARLRDRPLSRLSGGEARRVLLARVLAGEPRILLADEPVAGLDPGHRIDVMSLLAASAAGGAGVAVVLHDLTLAARYCTRLVLLHEGRVAAAGPPGAVLTPGLLDRCYGVTAFHTDLDGRPVVVPVARTRCPDETEPAR